MLKRVSSADSILDWKFRGKLLCRKTQLAAFIAGLALIAMPARTQAACDPLDCGPCAIWHCLNGEPVCNPRSSSTPCNDGNVCTINDHCDGNGSCVGGAYASTSTSCSDGNACTTPDWCNGAGACVGVPGVPGNISGPTTTNTSGSYTLSWTAACGSVTQY